MKTNKEKVNFLIFNFFWIICKTERKIDEERKYREDDQKNKQTETNQTSEYLSMKYSLRQVLKVDIDTES